MSLHLREARHGPSWLTVRCRGPGALSGLSGGDFYRSPGGVLAGGWGSWGQTMPQVSKLSGEQTLGSDIILYYITVYRLGGYYISCVIYFVLFLNL